jgi:hypothetical protein
MFRRYVTTDFEDPTSGASVTFLLKLCVSWNVNFESSLGRHAGVFMLEN